MQKEEHARLMFNFSQIQCSQNLLGVRREFELSGRQDQNVKYSCSKNLIVKHLDSEDISQHASHILPNNLRSGSAITAMKANNNLKIP